MSGPYDPFQRPAQPLAAVAAPDPFPALTERWRDLWRRYDADTEETPAAEARRDREYAEISALENRILAIPIASVAGVFLKVRIFARIWDCMHGGDAWEDGPPALDEQLIASAVADIERLAGGAA